MSDRGTYPTTPVHFADFPARGIPEELALEELLLQQAESLGRCLVRIWEPATTAVILGASGKIAVDVFPDACAAAAIPIYRRSSGGGVVIIGPGVLNATVIWPRSLYPELEAVDTAQRFVMDRLATALQAHSGLPIAMAGSGDLVWDGRKCAGSAQRRAKTMLLVHTCLLHNADLSQMDSLLPIPSRQPDYRNQRPHRDFVTNLPVPREILIQAVRTAWIPPDLHQSPAPWPEVPDPDVLRSMCRERFDNPEWIARF